MRSEQEGSYSTEDTDTEDPPQNGHWLQKVQNQKESFEFAKNRTGWVSSDNEGCFEQQHYTDCEEKHSSVVYICPSRIKSLYEDERSIHLSSNNSVIRQKCNERYFEGQDKEDGLIEEDNPNKRNRSSARKTSPFKAKKRKKVVKKIPKDSQLFISQHKDFTDDIDTKGIPQKKISSQKLQNQSKKIRCHDTEGDIEQHYIYDDEEMPNTKICYSESSPFNFSSENYNLQFPKCSSFVLYMGNQLGKHPWGSSLETLCSTNEGEPLTETSKNEILQELSQKMEKFSLNDQTGQEANVPPIDDFKIDHGNQVAVPGDGNSVDNNQVFNFVVGDLRFDFKPSPQLKARKIVYKKNRNVRRLLFKSNKGALYLKTII